MKLSLLSIRLSGLVALLPLASCTQSHPAAARPAATVAAAPSVPGAAGPAHFTEADTGHTAHIGLGETVVIKLAVNESTGRRWFLRNALNGGVVFKKGNTTYEQTPQGTVATLVYQGGKVGTQELHFYYAPPEARQNVTRTADYRVVVH